MSENTEKKNETPLKGHTREGKELNPPFLANGMRMKNSSWFDERLPEMLWAILVIGNLERDRALEYFRYIAKYVQVNQDCFNVTLTGIASLPDDKRKAFIKYFSSYSEEVNLILRILLLFPNLPAYGDWKEIYSNPDPTSDWQKLADAVLKSAFHQSQEATDCRWIKILCVILGGKLQFPRAMEETVRGILEYPNFGDMKSVRPSIRAMEITPAPEENGGESIWATSFWKYCFDNTGCFPEEAVNKKIQLRQEKLSEEMEESRKVYFPQTKEIRNKLIDHFFETSKTSSIDSRHEGAFGLALYGLSLFIEIIFYRTPLSVTGRLGLRALVEVYITFSYLLQKERVEPRVWDDFRSYGTGQVKLVYLKLQEINSTVSSIELDAMDMIANEDKWLEFVSINLGHWDSANLRKMAEEVGLKDLYDKYYNYTSGFMHGNWGAIRESVFQKCVNSLHRFHRVPTYDLPLMPSVTVDALGIMNKILDCLSLAYPSFEPRFIEAKQADPDKQKGEDGKSAEDPKENISE